MGTLKKWLPCAVLAFVVGAELIRYCSEPRTEVRETVRTDTLTVVRVDTVVVEKPVPVRVAEKEPVYIQVPVPGDTVFLPGDTLTMPVPIYQYSFRDIVRERLQRYPRQAGGLSPDNLPDRREYRRTNGDGHKTLGNRSAGRVWL